MTLTDFTIKFVVSYYKNDKEFSDFEKLTFNHKPIHDFITVDEFGEEKDWNAYLNEVKLVEDQNKAVDFMHGEFNELIKQKTELEFSVSGNIVSLTRSDVIDDYYEIDLKNASLKHIYKQENDVKTSLTFLHQIPGDNEWQCNYQQEFMKENKKQIMSYDCFQQNIEEIKTNSLTGEKEKTFYRMMVTDQLSLPAWAIIGLWKPVGINCPLHVLKTSSRIPGLVTEIKAVKVADENKSSEKNSKT